MKVMTQKGWHKAKYKIQIYSKRLASEARTRNETALSNAEYTHTEFYSLHIKVKYRTEYKNILHWNVLKSKLPHSTKQTNPNHTRG
jgi:hypothetical protein